jgi:hypothetical protein
MDVLIALAEYYCPGKVLDGRKREEYLNSIMSAYEIDDNMSMMAVRYKTLKEDQVKLNIFSTGEKKQLVKDIAGTPIKYQVAFLSQNAISLTDDIQIVLRFSGDVEKIHSTFDFIHATNYFTFAGGLTTNIEALQSIITKTLRYQGSLYPLTSVIRMKKFIQRGWTVNAGEILKMLFQVSELDLKDILVLEEQLIGVDVAYFAKLIEVLKDYKRDQITNSMLATLIDEVFNQYEEEDPNLIQ